MRREKIITLITSAVFILVSAINHFIINPKDYSEKVLKVGFVYDGDESIPYTNNFIRSQYTLKEYFKDKIEIVAKSNVPPDRLENALDDLVAEECSIIFTTSYSHAIITKEYAEKHPKIHFCQACGDNVNEEPVLKNYHAFMGEIYQGRYAAGVVAGLKLQEMINDNKITEEEAKLGYVGAYPFASVISGFTAFLLGARSIVPTASLTVMYTYTWSSFSEEKACTEHLIDEGCVIISQHTDTIAPAIACEEAYGKNVFHIGYNQSMVDIAPTTSLTGIRINWSPYIIGAVSAILENKSIEKVVKGHTHGNDIGAGFDYGWVQMLELNSPVAEGTEKVLNRVVQGFKKGKISVFKGNYLGVNVDDDEDIYDLKKEFKDCASSSAPTFRYILKDVITIDEMSLFDN